MQHAEPARPLATPPPAQGAIGSLRVLIVDDDIVDRMAVRRSLARAGVDAAADEAPSADATFELVERESYDCILLDYNLPGTDGLAVLRGIRARGIRVPVIMLTGQGDEEIAVELMKAGAVDYLSKSVITPDRLAQSLRYAVELSRAESAARWAEEELVRRAERTRFLAEASRALATPLDVTATLQLVARLAVPILADYCIIYLADETGAPRGIAAAHSNEAMEPLARELERRYRPGRDHPTSGVAIAMRTGRTYVVDPLTDEHLAAVARTPEDLEVFRALNPAAVVCVPLLARGSTLGAMAFTRTTPGRHFSEDEIALAEDLGQRAAVALDNVRLLESTELARRRAERAAERTERLQRLTAALADAVSADVVGELVMQHGVLATGAYAGVLAFLGADGEHLVLQKSVGYPPEACMSVGRQWPISTRIPIAEATRARQPVFIESEQQWADRYLDGYLPSATPARSASRAWAAVPLLVEGHALGALLWTFDQPRRFEDEDRAFFEAIGQQCAQALERARLREAERQARAAAEEANRAKSEFLARMSHDLRTPLNAIGGYAQLVELGLHGEITEPQRDAMQRIRRAQDHLLTLINDILSFAKLEAGQVKLEIQAVPVDEVLGGVRALIEPQVAEKELSFDYQPGPESVMVRADRERLLQVLVNLLTNAVKFTDAGGSVALSWDAPPDVVRIHVRDTGIGIPEDRLVSIFDPFVQVVGSPAEERHGVGLGLAISRELTRLMGGELTVASEVGEGSVFTLTLQRAM